MAGLIVGAVIAYGAKDATALVAVSALMVLASLLIGRNWREIEAKIGALQPDHAELRRRRCEHGRGRRRRSRIGLLDPDKVIDGVKVLVPKAYPMYDARYEEAVPVIRRYLEGLSNFQTCGRNGLHRYNDQDHSMWTAIMAVLNLVDGADHDVWSVNAEASYHEEGETVESALRHSLASARLSGRATERIRQGAPFDVLVHWSMRDCPA